MTYVTVRSAPFRGLQAARPVGIGPGQKTVFGRHSNVLPMRRNNGTIDPALSRKALEIFCPQTGGVFLRCLSASHGLVIRNWGKGIVGSQPLHPGDSGRPLQVALSAGMWTVRIGPKSSREPDLQSDDQVSWLVLHVTESPSGSYTGRAPGEATWENDPLAASHRTTTTVPFGGPKQSAADAFELSDNEFDVLLRYFAEFLAIEPPRLVPAMRTNDEAAKIAGLRNKPVRVRDTLYRLRERASHHGCPRKIGRDAELLSWLIERHLLDPLRVNDALRNGGFGV